MMIKNVLLLTAAQFFLNLALVNLAGALFGRILTEVVSTD